MIASQGSFFVEFSAPEMGIAGSVSSIDLLVDFSSYLRPYGVFLFVGVAMRERARLDGMVRNRLLAKR